MKLLRMTPYVTIDEHSHVLRNATGFGRTCWDLTQNWNAKDEVFLQTYCRKDIPELSKIKFLKYNIIDVILHADMGDIVKCIRFLNRYLICKNERIMKEKLKTVLDFLRSYMAKGSFIRTIREVAPDVIHIHGITPSTFSFIDAARKAKIPYVINIHGLVTPTNFEFPYGNDWEKKVLKNIIESNDTLVSISSGIFKYAQDVWGLQWKDNKAKVVINGCKKSKTYNTTREERAIIRKEIIGDKYEHVLISVGSVTIEKGQRNILKALAKLPVSVYEKTILLVIGNGPDKSYCEEYVNKNGLQDHVIFMGYIPNDELDKYYIAADLLAQASRGPGFSRMYWESFTHGTPAIACSKQPGITDIFSEDCMVLVEDYTGEKIAEGVVIALSKQWDRQKIADRNQYYYWDSRCEEYREILIDVSKERCSEKEPLLDYLLKI